MNPTGARATVIIPAHDEQAVIARTLRCVLGDDRAPRVLVVCNGCHDRTAALVREQFPQVDVLELTEASKIGALNAGLAAAAPGPVLLLDADIDLPAQAARALLEAVLQPDIEAAIGFMDLDTTGASYPVRAFYRVWLQHPYLREGKFAAAIALSAAGRDRVGQLPRVTADDTYLRGLFPRERVAVVPQARFRARAPRTLGALLRVRTRSHRGNRELARRAPAAGAPTAEGWAALLRRVLPSPALWPALPVYAGVTLLARLRARRAAGSLWERDDTSRAAAPAGNS